METIRVSEENSGSDSNRFTTSLVLCLVLLPAVITILGNNQNSSFSLTGVFRKNARNAAVSPAGEVLNATSDSRKIPPDHNVQDTIFSHRLDQKSCLSRSESLRYRKPSPYKPSPYLLSKLQNYQELHKRCGPNSESYRRSSFRLKSSKPNSSSSCKYIIWTPANGLGNRMISLASTFLYAPLTNRVLLLDHGKDMENLFCEPFPESSWLLPRSFPLRNHRKNRYSHSFATVLKANASKMPPLYLYINLAHNGYMPDKKLFYCEKTESFLGYVTWLVIRSDQYFTPYFFLSKTYRKEVAKMFPEKDTVFHHLGSSLFNPTNEAWGLITRFYNAYLAKADQKVGLQFFSPKKTRFQTVLDQLLNCTLTEKILPEAGMQKPFGFRNHTPKSKAVLVTSLHDKFYTNLSNMYWTRPTATGEVIGFYQPSHEQFQHVGGSNEHNMKAWAEIYLLSMTDVLLTSARSTFGYVAQALGGLKPWILFMKEGENIPSQSCTRDLSMEPCFHFPPSYGCEKTEAKVDVGARVPYLRHCLDLNWGLKLVHHKQ